MRVLIAVAMVMGFSVYAVSEERPRLLVLTDIGGDPDDTQSLIRLLVHSNEFEIEGLIASASGTPGELKEAVTRPDLIRGLIEAYGEVRENLALHAEGFPTAETLLERVVSGNPQRGWKYVGDGHDTAGSKHIIEVVGRDDFRSVNITIWGGQTDFAQALWRVKKDRGEEGYEEFIKKIRVYDINDQDKIFEQMSEAFPGIFYVLAKAPEGEDKRLGAYRGMYLDGDESLTSREWVETHVLKGHGPLGGMYPTKTWTAPNPHSTLKEGDTPSWLYFLPSGLSDPEHPKWGGWGGRFEAVGDSTLFRDAKDEIDGETTARGTVWRWRPYFQNEFQARMDWCVKPFEEANHPPVAVLNGDGSRDVLRVKAKAGAAVQLSGAGSTDPDSDQLSYEWRMYPEAGSYRREVSLATDKPSQAELRIPMDAVGKTMHVLLAVTDDGTPALTSFRRMVIEVEGQ